MLGNDGIVFSHIISVFSQGVCIVYLLLPAVHSTQKPEHFFLFPQRLTLPAAFSGRYGGTIRELLLIAYNEIEGQCLCHYVTNDMVFVWLPFVTFKEIGKEEPVLIFYLDSAFRIAIMTILCLYNPNQLQLGPQKPGNSRVQRLACCVLSLAHEDIDIFFAKKSSN